MHAESLHDPFAVDVGRSRGRASLVVAVLLVLLLAAAAAVAAGLRVERRPELYRSQAVLQIDQEPAVALSRDNGLLVKLVTLRIKFAGQLQTTTFGTALAETTGLPRGVVGGALSSVLPADSLLMTVAATTRAPGDAEHLAQAAAEKLAADLDRQQELLGIAPNQRVTLTVVSPAQGAAKVQPLRKTALRDGGAAGGVVLVVGLALVVAWRRR